MAKIFIKQDNEAFLTEDSNKRPRFERNIRTLEIDKKDNKFIIYEKFRKKKDKRLKTIKAIKGRSEKTIIRDIQQDNIKINSKQMDSRTTEYGRLNTVQTSYKPRSKKVFKQIVCLVRVSDTSRMLLDHYIGYSRKIISAVPTQSEWQTAENQAIDMAVSKFIKDYGLPRERGDIDNSYMQEDSGALTDYGKAKDFGNIEAKVLIRRYQFYQKVFKN